MKNVKCQPIAFFTSLTRRRAQTFLNKYNTYNIIYLLAPCYLPDTMVACVHRYGMVRNEKNIGLLYVLLPRLLTRTVSLPHLLSQQDVITKPFFPQDSVSRFAVSCSYIQIYLSIGDHKIIVNSTIFSLAAYRIHCRGCIRFLTRRKPEEPTDISLLVKCGSYFWELNFQEPSSRREKS